MKKLLSIILSLFIIGLVTFSNVSADDSDYVYIKITKIELVRERVYCPTTDSWNCNSNKHLHKLVEDYKYYLENGDVLYLTSDEIDDLVRQGIIKGRTYRVNAYVKIKDVRIESERVYCPTTDSWDCHSNKHLHMLVCTYRYTLVNGQVFILTDEEVNEYYRTGKIKDGKMKIY